MGTPTLPSFFDGREKKYPIGLINVEKKIEIFGKQKRYDIVVYTKTGTVAVLVECKAPKIEINQGVFDQIARYNLSVDSTYLMVTNGLKHVYCQMDYQAQAYHFLQDLPPPIPLTNEISDCYFELERKETLGGISALDYPLR